MMLLVALFLLSVILSLLCYWLFGYWDRKNVFNVKFEITFHTLYKVLIKKEHLGDIFSDIYRRYKGYGLIGFYTLFYTLFEPMLLVTDPKLVETVIVKDFNKFHDTTMEMKKDVNPLFAMNAHVAKGIKKWKELRSIQASNTTAVRFKEVLPIMYRVAENMVNYLSDKKMEPIAAKQLSFLYTMENACLCGFGIECHAFNDPENHLVKYSKKIYKSSPFTMFCHFLLPRIANILKLRILSEDGEEFLKSFFQKIMECRYNSNSDKNDFIDYLLKLNTKFKEENKPAYSNLELAAHCMTFYLDNTETTSNQLAFFLLDLANHQQVQDKLREEIISISNSPKDFNLEKVNSIKYLNMALDESLRLHTLGTWLSRTCTEDTAIGNTPIAKGTKVFVPVESFHKDPEYFPDPEKFVPERFLEENKDTFPKYAFLPFGEGPRICVGYKSALLQIRLAVIFLLLNFHILPYSEDGREKIVLENTSLPTPSSKLMFEPINMISRARVSCK